MLELISGGGSTAVGRGASGGNKPTSGLDFARFLQEAQEGGHEPRAETLQQPKKRPAALEKPEKEEQIKATEDETAVDGESEETAEGEKLDDAAKMAAQPLADAPVEEIVVEELVSEDGTLSAEDLESAWALPVPVAKDESKAATDSGDSGDLGVENMEAPAVGLAAPPVETSSPLELLNFTELMDPDLVVEKSPEQIVSRIVQAAGAQLPVMEEMAETVLPQVIRGVASLVRAGGAEMRIQLQPADLGEIELRVRTTEAMVRGEMMVQNPEVKQLLEHNMDRLRSALAQEGLELQGFSVDVGDQSRFARDGEDQQGSGSRREGAGDSNESAQPAVVGAVGVASPRRPDNGDMDFTA